MNSLSQKLKALKESSALQDQSTRSKEDSLKPFPLASFLLIYIKAEKECYIERMEGTKCLYKFLFPIEFPSEEEVMARLSKEVIPELLISYEIQELVKIFVPELDLKKRIRVQRAILYTLISQIYREL